MRRRIMVLIDGRPVPSWSENDPGAYAVRSTLGGSLVQGEPGAAEKQRIAERAFKARQKA
jgi:hypothetical protein